jgi:type III secretory pathway lipoprotein EscJ
VQSVRYFNYLLVYVLLAISGCDSRIELVRNISQKQTLVIVSVLSKVGIQASTRSDSDGSKEGRFSILIYKRDYGSASQILVEHGLPEEEGQSLGDLLEVSTFLPQTRMMEGLRIDRALSLEIEDHFNALPGIVGCKVLVRSVPHTAVNERGVSVMIFTKDDPTKKETIDTEFVNQHLKTMFPDLPLERFKVSVINVKSDKSSAEGYNVGYNANSIPVATSNSHKGVSFLWLWNVEEENYLLAALCVILFFLVAGVVGAAVGIWWISYLAAHIRAEGTRMPVVSGKENEKSRGVERDRNIDDSSVTGTRRIMGNTNF